MADPQNFLSTLYQASTTKKDSVYGTFITFVSTLHLPYKRIELDMWEYLYDGKVGSSLWTTTWSEMKDLVTKYTTLLKDYQTAVVESQQKQVTDVVVESNYIFWCGKYGTNCITFTFKFDYASDLTFETTTENLNGETVSTAPTDLVNQVNAFQQALKWRKTSTALIDSSFVA
eukprot:CAMPEP_0202897264 /NCGR_PEP_ID=MMETSP1392-20130828/6078_1 /ASSEMBLY_ACC=CAM_ASM_000868 /TAXON_ID=225041 /ORGANISM="Chlamydomonas chlamydogama, Strain SAG 11-48b" /LENGTH=172 /DNA_ID=CAMNT_0049582863 /DNA_START=4 /DNA_END=518 /DNA_ORIENTATION=-